MSAVRRLRGTTTILGSFRGQRRALFVPREQLLAWRDGRVRATVRHAAEHVPHYRDLFRREGIAAAEIRTADDLQHVPLLDRVQVQEEPGRFVDERLSARELLALSSGGSTGVRVRILHDRGSLLRNIGFAERERMVEERLVGSRRYTIIQVMRTGATARVVRAFYDREAFRPFRPEQHLVDITAPLEHVYAEIARVRPQVIWTSGALLDQLVRDALESGRTLEPLRVLVYGGDAMTAGGVDLAQRKLGLPVLSQYAAVEALKIGFLCEERQGFHLHEDLCHVAVVDDDGRRLPSGRRGEIVISNLVNRGTVLLNYRIGDMGTIGGEPCPCGRTALLLASLDGRVHEVVQLRSGKSIVPSPLEGAITGYDQVRAYQLLQLEPDRFELRLVTPDGAFDRIAVILAEELSAMLENSRVDVVRVDEIDHGAGGKYPRIAPGRR